jgi:predicted nucleic acid-binding Zn ribbon protein
VRARSAGPAHTSARAPVSVSTLLSRISQSRAGATLARVAEQRQAQEDWRSWLKNRLSAQLDAHVTGAVEREGSLTVFADSAVWSARLRFVVADLEGQIRERNATIGKVAVKVMPRR